MTKRQVEMLRGLIQAEIKYAIQEYVRENPWSYETKQENDEFWRQFAETFNSSTGPFEIYD